VLVFVTDLPIKPSRDWLHMDQVESEKLAWMKDLPAPSAGDNKVCFPVFWPCPSSNSARSGVVTVYQCTGASKS